MLDTVDESFVIAEEALVIIGGGVAEAQGAVRALGGSMEEGQEALDSLAALDGRIDAAAGLVGGYVERATEAALLVELRRDTLDTTAGMAAYPPWRRPRPRTTPEDHPIARQTFRLGPVVWVRSGGSGRVGPLGPPPPVCRTRP